MISADYHARAFIEEEGYVAAAIHAAPFAN